MKYDRITRMSTITASNSKTKKRGHIFRMPKGCDRWIHYAMILLAIFGIIMVGSASMGLAVGDNTYLAKTVAKQAGFAVLGYFAMAWLANHFTLKFLKTEQFSYLIIITAALLLLCLAFGSTGGASAWIRLPVPGIEVTIQPSEFTKIMAVLIIAAYCGDVTKQFPSAFEMLKRPIGFILIYIIIIVFLQDDFGSAAVIFLMACICLLIPNHPQMKKFQRFLKICFWLLVVAVGLLMSPAADKIIDLLPLQEYQKNRFLSALNPFADQYNTGYQLVNGLVSFATGGIKGVGFGNSIRKYTDFPAANTDFILAIIVEELGYFGFIILFAIYGVIIFSLLKYAERMKNEKARIILVGTAMYFVIHIFFNVGGVTGLIPLTGVPLLMISAGGSSTLSIMACVGIAQAVISAYERHEIE